MPEHTPGEWVRDGTIFGAGDLQIDLRLDDGGDNWVTVKGPNAEANVKLIAAAPNLLHSLTECVEMILAESSCYPGCQCGRCIRVAGARAAIAKATKPETT